MVSNIWLRGENKKSGIVDLFDPGEVRSPPKAL